VRSSETEAAGRTLAGGGDFVKEATYLGALASSARELFGDGLVGAYVGGSWALGAYRPPGSDLDVALVVSEPLNPAQRAATVQALRHEALPCPARGLELVVYTETVVRSASVQPAFELDLNTGRALPWRAEAHPDDVAGRHWYAIDRSILAERGVALTGPPPSEVFAPLPRDTLLPLLAASVRWHRDSQPDDPSSLLNACRALHRLHENEWISKPQAARWFLDYAADHVGYG
jgi:aminoglycoside adenylyltransferase-like protein